MPLVSGKSKKAFTSNIKELVKANKDKPDEEKRSMRQILAIAYAKKRESKKGLIG